MAQSCRTGDRADPAHTRSPVIPRLLKTCRFHIFRRVEAVVLVRNVDILCICISTKLEGPRTLVRTLARVKRLVFWIRCVVFGAVKPTN